MSTRRLLSLRPACASFAVALAACSTTLAPNGPITSAVGVSRVDGMAITASAALVEGEDRTVRVTIRFENEEAATATTTILGGNCMIMVRLYEASTGVEVWSQFDEVQACQEPAATVELAPGEDHSFSTDVQVDVDGGTYLVTGTIQQLSGLGTNFIELLGGNVVFP